MKFHEFSNEEIFELVVDTIGENFEDSSDDKNLIFTRLVTELFDPSSEEDRLTAQGFVGYDSVLDDVLISRDLLQD